MRSTPIQFLGMVGIVLIVTMNKAFKDLRERLWPGLLGCPQCFGVWAGTAGYYWFERDRVFADGLIEAGQIVVDALMLGFAVSLVSYLLYCYVKASGAP